MAFTPEQAAAYMAKKKEERANAEVDTSTGAGFVPRLKASFASNKDTEIRSYQNSYGKENVSVDDDGNILVREKGKWLRADPSGLDVGDVTADFAGEIPEIVYGGIGTALGSFVGQPAAGAAGGSAIGNAMRQNVSMLLGDQAPNYDKADIAISGAFGAGGEAVGRHVVPKVAKFVGDRFRKATKAAVEPAADETTQGAMRAAKEVAELEPGFELSLGEQGSKLGASLEARQRENFLTQGAAKRATDGKQTVIGKAMNTIFGEEAPQDLGNTVASSVVGKQQANKKILGESQAAVDDSLGALTGDVAPVHELGKKVTQAIKDARVATRERLNKAYNLVKGEVHGDEAIMSQARDGVLSDLLEILEREGMVLHRDAATLASLPPGTPKIEIAKAGYGEGQIKTAIDPDVANKIRSFFLDEELRAPGAPDYLSLNRLRKNLGNLLDDKTKVFLNPTETEAALDQAYGSFRRAQDLYLTDVGASTLDHANKLFQANLADLKELAHLPQEQNILNVFGNKSAPQIAAMRNKLKEAGQEGVFDELRRAYLRELADKSPEVFEKELKKLGSGVRETYFGDVLARDVQTLASLKHNLSKNGADDLLGAGAIDEIYGGFTNAGRNDMMPLGLEDLSIVSKVVDEPQNILNVFRTSDSSKINALFEHLDAAGKPEVFDQLKQTYLKDLVEKSTPKQFEKALQMMGPETRERFFSDNLTQTAQDFVALNEVMKRAGQEANRPGSGLGRMVLNLYQYSVGQLADPAIMAALNSDAGKTIVRAIQSDSAILPAAKARLLRIISEAAAQTGARAVGAKLGDDYFHDDAGKLVINIRGSKPAKTAVGRAMRMEQ